MRSFLSVFVAVLALVALCVPAQAHGVAVVRVRAFVPFTPVVTVATPVVSAVAVDSCGVQAQAVVATPFVSTFFTPFVSVNPFFSFHSAFVGHAFVGHNVNRAVIRHRRR